MIIAGTGHRPKYCPCKYNEKHEWLLNLKVDIKNKLLELGAAGVISGMAIGFDTWLAQVALDMGLQLRCYVPFIGQGDNWPSNSKKEYNRILDLASSIEFISNSYSNEAFLKRDRRMIDDCNEVFALLNPESTSGGTYYTVQYALENKKKVHHLWQKN